MDFQGHRAFWFDNGADNLVTGFDIQGRWYHDLSVTGYEQVGAEWGAWCFVARRRASPAASRRVLSAAALLRWQ